MVIDNSQAKEFQTCPQLFYEKRVKGIEKNWRLNGPSAADFGTRMHEILEEHYLEMKGTPRDPYPQHENDALELEAQAMFALYRNHYPVESFSVLDVEKTFRVPLIRNCPECGGGGVEKLDLQLNERVCTECGHIFIIHEYVGKFDVILRDNDTGMLSIMDHKTQARRSPNNKPLAWAARSQGTLYLWAAPQIYGGPFRDLIVNVLQRQSDAGQIPPEFPERQRIQRNPEQIEVAVRDLIVVADTIEEYKRKWPDGNWPANRNNCMDGFWACEFYDAHLMGWSDDLLRKFVPTTPYLDL